MKICIDLRPLQIGHENRGIGMYLRSVLEHLIKDENQYIFYCFEDDNPIDKLSIDIHVPYTLVVTPKVSTIVNSPKNLLGMIRLINHRFKALKKYKPDIFIQPDFALGIPRWRHTNTYVVGYDLIPLIFRHDYLPGINYAWAHALGKKAKLRAIVRSVYYRFKYRIHYSVYKRATHIIAISNSTRKSFIDLLKINPNRITSIPLAPVLSRTSPDYSVVSNIKKPYIFYIGGTDSRKRIQDIIHAYNIARGKGANLDLVLAGNEFVDADTVPSQEGRKALIESPYLKDIHLVGFVTAEQKTALYEKSEGFIFASVYEGFGMPIVEAMAAGCPVIAYDNSSIPEAAGDAALLVPSMDYVALSRKIISLQDKTLVNKLTAAGRKQAASFSWENYIKKLTALITS
jgi:glycosyltransferase involved in cell wall biosynthesis